VGGSSIGVTLFTLVVVYGRCSMAVTDSTSDKLNMSDSGIPILPFAVESLSLNASVLLLKLVL